MSEYVYSFNTHVVILGATTIVGYGDSAEGILIEYESDLITDSVGADGDVVTNLIRDYRATITLRLHQRSPSGAYLSGLLTAYRTGTVPALPFLLRDSSGATFHSAENARIMAAPSASYGAESSLREWRLRASDLTSFIGGG